MLHGGYTFFSPLFITLNAGKISTILGSYGEHLCVEKKIIKRKARETGDIVDKVSERERERERELRASELRARARERRYKSYHIVLVRIPTYIIGFDSIRLASIWLWL